MSMNLTFLGAAGTVTGSKYLVENGSSRILVDCGLFQGFKPLRLKNWARLPVEPASLASVVLTHAHLDHSGYLPLLVKNGYRRQVFCSGSTADLCEVLLTDAGHLQEKDAEFANRYRFSKHKPALPLYTVEDARNALKQFREIAFGRTYALTDGVMAHLRRTGHILGAASVELAWSERKVVFSGDLGRYNDPIMRDPEEIKEADYLVVESTYGNRLHERTDPEVTLTEVVARTVGRGGTVVIPAFAVGRAQSLLFYLQRIKASGKLTNVPIFLDSPMAQDASEIFCRNVTDHRLSEKECRTACAIAHYVRSVEESKALTTNPHPKVIISASGMATGGRVLHHLKQYVTDPKNTILFAGFQAGGTRGAAMMAGADKIKIHGGYFPVSAEIRNLEMLSAHADAGEIMRWLRGFETRPKMTFITHGEPAAADALRLRIQDELGWPVTVPEHGQRVQLD
jgi:metallo-beta-lactamase family protein